MTSQQRWYWVLDYFDKKSAFCTVYSVAKLVPEVCVSVNLAYVK